MVIDVFVAEDLQEVTGGDMFYHRDVTFVEETGWLGVTRVRIMARTSHILDYFRLFVEHLSSVKNDQHPDTPFTSYYCFYKGTIKKFEEDVRKVHPEITFLP